MHHIVGRAAGYLALPTWATYITATVVNAVRPAEDRVFRGELLMMFAVLGLMLGVAWIAHAAVLLSTEEREDLYKQGARDAWSVPPPSDSAIELKSILKHQTQRLNGAR